MEIILQEAFIKAVDKLPSLQKRIDKITQDLIYTDCNLNGKYKDHQLKYNLAEYRELHILGDKLLIYKVNKNDNTITFEDIVTHKALKRKSNEESWKMSENKPYSLIGVNADAYAVMAYVSEAMRAEGKSADEIDEYLAIAKSEDYTHLLEVSMGMCSKLNEEKYKEQK